MSIDLETVRKTSVVEWRVPASDAKGIAASFPQAKLYNPQGALVSWGMPPAFSARLAGQAPPAEPVPNAKIQVVRLAEELKLLRQVPDPHLGKPALVLYTNADCPPCEGLLEPVIAASRAKYGSGLAIFRVRVH